jgi:tetratricopeptide (TPR) repeat protein/tRNA A-37 threonylcarbamoyl transferase component Bud32
MAQANSDRNLLFGILALQMDFITRDQLVAAMQGWVFDKSQTLGQILQKQGALAEDTHALLEALVQKHLAQHGNDIEKSLAAVSPAGQVRAELKRVADADVQASLVRAGAAKPAAEDPFATTAPSVGTGSSSGLRFRILRPHARGGLGEVLVARDEELHREVALKQIQTRHAQDRQSQVRFILEAEITGGLEHPGIVPVYGLGQYADGRPFYAMRFIRGDSLKEAIERFHKVDKPGRDPSERSLELRSLLGRFVDVCNAISYAHSRGVLHRDLKPGNIMLGKYGETLVVDWGLAKPQDGPATPSSSEPGEGTLTPSSAGLASHTIMGEAMGTPQFMSPEQAAGRHDILGPASDVYSLGATLYTLLTGFPPIQDTDVVDVLRKVQRGEIPPPRQVKPDVPRALEAICLKAMALEPGNRYASTKELADDIEHWLADEPVSAWSEPWTVRARRWLGRHRTLVTAAASAVLVATVGLAVATALLTAANDRERAARTLAEENAERVRKEKDETEKQRKIAEHNFQLARKAVDRYHTEVSEDVLLNEPGMQPLRKKLLEAASEFYAQFVRERGKEPGLQAELGKAKFRLARITGDIDSEPKAIELHLEAKKIFNGLGTADPDQQSELAECCFHLGQLFRKTNQFDKAEECFKQALAIWEPLAGDHPKVDRYRAEVARSQLGLGNVHLAKRRPAWALALYEKALDIRFKLAEANPKVTAYQRDLAKTYDMVAKATNVLGQTNEAGIACGKGLAIQIQLVQAFPHISQYQNDLAASHFELGNLQRGVTSNAEKSYQEAARLWKELVDKHPTVIEFQIKLAETYIELSKVYSSAASTIKAEAICKKAIEIKQKLARDQSGEASYQDDVARGYHQLGNVYRAGQQRPQAEAAYQDALRILEKIANDFPAVPQYQISLAKVYDDFGQLRTDEAEKEKAEEAFRKALSTWDKLDKANPGNIEIAVPRSRAALRLGTQVLANGNLDGALEWFAQAIRILEILSQQQSATLEVKEALRDAHWKRGEVLTKVGRHGEALQDWDRALKLAGQKASPIKLQRAVALARAGKHAEAVAEAEALAKKVVDAKSPGGAYQLGCVFALSAGAVVGDVKRTLEERQELAEHYAVRAVELLAAARGFNYFKAPADVDTLKQNPDFDAIRTRADFKKLLEELEHKGKTQGTGSGASRRPDLLPGVARVMTSQPSQML